MSTTLKLSDELKTRVAAVARGSGTTPHAFMVDAIRNEADRAEKRRAFVESALASRADFEKSGMAYDMADVHAFILAKAAGKEAKHPRKKQWRK